jgi:O-antigen/teichoic acid export membrane protein
MAGHREAARSAGPVAGAGVAVNVVVAATTLAVARLLNSRQYGTFIELVAVFYVLTMPGLALAIAVVRRVTSQIAHEGRSAVAGWVSRVRRQVYLLCAAGFAVGAVLSEPIARLLAIRSTGGLVETFAAGALWTIACFERALLQARQAYPAYAANLVLEGVLRCVVTLAAVGTGLGVPGAAAGLLISLPAAIGHAGWAEHRLPLTPAAEHPPAARREPAGRARHDALFALGALGLLAVLQNVDVLVLGRHDPASSGSYGAVSVACKSLVLVAFVLAGFLLPEAASRRAIGHHAMTPLVVSLTFVAIPSALLILLAAAEGHPLLSLAFGSRLANASAAFTPLAVAMALLAVSVVLTHYLLAAGERPVLWLLLVAGVGTTLALAIAGTSPRRVAWTDAVAQAALTVCLTGLVGLHHRRVLSQHRRLAQ